MQASFGSLTTASMIAQIMKVLSLFGLRDRIGMPMESKFHKESSNLEKRSGIESHLVISALDTTANSETQTVMHQKQHNYASAGESRVHHELQAQTAITRTCTCDR